jgi:hypothetical protein
MIFYEPKLLGIPVKTPVRCIWSFTTHIKNVTNVSEYGYEVHNLTYDLYGFFISKRIKKSNFFSVAEMKEIICGNCRRIVSI